MLGYFVWDNWDNFPLGHFSDTLVRRDTTRNASSALTDLKKIIFGMNININKRLGNQKLVYFPTFFEVRWAKKILTDPWSQCRWCCYWHVLASRQPTLWTCSWIRESNRSVWCCSLHLMQILSGRQDDSLSPTSPVPIQTSEIESLSSQPRTAPQYVVLCRNMQTRAF